MDFKYSFDYADVRLIPKKSIVISRKDCDTSVKDFGECSFRLPVVPANMKSVINFQIAKYLAENNYFYVMHRFNIDTVDFIMKFKELNLFTSISIGVNESDYSLIDRLASYGLVPDYITIDIAHGHSILMEKMLHFIKNAFYMSNKKPFIIAGNVGTPEAVRFLEIHGADAAKVGIGPGKVCITTNKTGFGTNGWQLDALAECAKIAKIPLVADGGIRNNGDITKSIVFGATMVMVGSLFSNLEESPGDSITVWNKEGISETHKEYFGSASEFNKSDKRNIEGKKIYQKVEGTLSDKLKEMTEDLQSSISYAGGTELADLLNTQYVLLK